MLKLTDLVRSLGRWADKTERQVKGKLTTPAEALLESVQDQLSRPGHGKTYRSRHHRGGLHRASAAGEPPAPDTRELIRSAHIEEREGKKIRVAVDGPGAAQLEFGTREIFPRSYMRAALENARAKMASRFIAALKRGDGK